MRSDADGAWVCAVCCVQRRELTVRGECGNRHSRREAGGRDGVTTLQHGPCWVFFPWWRPEPKRKSTRVRPLVFSPCFATLVGRFERKGAVNTHTHTAREEPREQRADDVCSKSRSPKSERPGTPEKFPIKSGATRSNTSVEDSLD